MSAAAPQGTEPRATVRSLQAVFAVNGAVYGTLLPRYPEIADRIQATEGEFGIALLGAGVGGLLGSAAVTWASRRSGGSVAVVRWGAPIMVSAALLAALAPTVAWLFVALAIIGLADGLVDPSMNTVAATAQEQTGTTFMGRLHATWSAATLSATGLGAVVAGLGVSVVTHAAVSIAVLLVVQVIAVRVLTRAVAAEGASGDGEVDATGADHPTESPVAPLDADADEVDELGTSVGLDDDAPDRSTSSRPSTGRPWGLWIAVVALTLSSVVIEIPPQEWAGLLLARELGAGPGLAGAGPFAFLGGVLAARIVLDRVVAALGWRRVMLLAGSTSVIAMTIALGVGAATESPWPVLLGLAVAGTGAAPVFPMMFDRATDIARRLGLAPDAGAGLVSGLARAGLLAAPIVVGQVADVAGLFVGLAVVPLAGAAIVLSTRIVLPR